MTVFHIEIASGHRWAREFNLDQSRLDGAVLERWVAGRPIALGDREWDPADCELRILEGPRLDGPELAFGRGWGAAKRSAREVTGSLVAAAAGKASRVAILAESDGGREAVARALAEVGLRSVTWSSNLAARADEASADGAPRPAAVVLAVESSEPRRKWLYEAGSAVGAMGGRAIVVQLGQDGPPPELADLKVAAPGPELSQALAAALERVGRR